MNDASPRGRRWGGGVLLLVEAFVAIHEEYCCFTGVPFCCSALLREKDDNPVGNPPIDAFVGVPESGGFVLMVFEAFPPLLFSGGA